MVIKMTVGNNDFGELMDSFVGNLSSYLLRCPDDIEERDGAKQLEVIREIWRVDKLINPNVTENHTEEDKRAIKKRIKELFSLVTEKQVNEETWKYLVDNFCVDIIDCVEDKWENGEMYYWFQHSGMYVCQ